MCKAAKKEQPGNWKEGMDSCQSYVANQYIADVFVHVCVPFSWIESHSCNIILPAKPWSSEFVSPNVAKTFFEKLGRIAK